MTYLSQQARKFRIAYRETGDVQAAREAAGWCDQIDDWLIGETEARLLIEHDQKNPPPPEAFQLLPEPGAKADAQPQKEDHMARAAKKEDGEGAGITGEYSRPNVEQAFKIYDSEIAPKVAKMATVRGDLSEPYKRIKDDCHFPRSVLNFIIGLENMEEAKRDHHLIALSDALKHRELHIPRDLVSIAEGKDGDNVVPFAEREKVDLPGVDDDETAEAAE